VRTPRRASSDWRALKRRGDALLIYGMTGLMHGRKQRAGRFQSYTIGNILSAQFYAAAVPGPFYPWRFSDGSTRIADSAGTIPVHILETEPS
jgi:hypothetical protein